MQEASKPLFKNNSCFSDHSIRTRKQKAPIGQGLALPQAFAHRWPEGKCNPVTPASHDGCGPLPFISAAGKDAAEKLCILISCAYLLLFLNTGYFFIFLTRIKVFIFWSKISYVPRDSLTFESPK